MAASLTGTVFEIREFSLFDGPGIRTTVFFKGCPLRCRWCHNPEGLRADPELLINRITCHHCGTCLKVCPNGAATGTGKCLACGRCAASCPTASRRLCGQKYDLEELVTAVMKHADIFRTSGGGVTLSGGEPLFQADFVISFCQALRKNGVHLTLETSGYALPEKYRDVIANVDLVFQDIKHSDPEKHRFYTGVDNERILTNFEYLKESGRAFIVRVPLIPTVNDAPECLEKIAELCVGSRNLVRVELLPYHLTAGAKYHLIGREYTPPFDEVIPTPPDLSPFQNRGIPCKIM